MLLILLRVKALQDLRLTALQAEGGLGDILQLDVMLKALGFSQMKADSEMCLCNIAAKREWGARLAFSFVSKRLSPALPLASQIIGCLHLQARQVRNLQSVPGQGEGILAP
eukprot:1155561-Pelagomonas_calceolata.AAC.1